jgi:hypothetical protein
MTPDDIKAGNTYIGHNGFLYTVNEIKNHKGTKLVKFTRHEPDPGRGTWNMKDFSKHMKERQIP